MGLGDTWLIGGRGFFGLLPRIHASPPLLLCFPLLLLLLHPLLPELLLIRFEPCLVRLFALLQLPVVLFLFGLDARLRLRSARLLGLDLYLFRILLGLLIVVDLQSSLKVRVSLGPLLHLGILLAANLESLRRVGVDGQGCRAVVDCGPRPAKRDQKLGTSGEEHRAGTADDDRLCELLQSLFLLAVIQQLDALLLQRILSVLLCFGELCDVGGRQRRKLSLFCHCCAINAERR
mmetsp:Transcript_97278/g.253516  ORF Transcript_97278/g.253516 Transcript_97278/m.253516 type:complete len:234 (+) Transcript_97278:127-828(+)